MPRIVPPAACAAKSPVARIAPILLPFALNSVQHRPADTAAKARCRSSVVEHSLGKGEVVSSILTGSTITLPLVAGLTAGV